MKLVLYYKTPHAHTPHAPVSHQLIKLENTMFLFKWWKHHDCSDYYHDEHHKLTRRILIGILALAALMLIIIILILIILRPTKPRFTLQDATLYNFNISSTSELPYSTLNLTMQATLSAHNPNDKIGIFYRFLDVYVSYRGQQVSKTVVLPPSYQDNKDITVWSPYLYGVEVPMPQYMVETLKEDENAGALMVKVVVEGGVKWKVGSWVSGMYHLHVNCPAYVRLSAGRLEAKQSCGVDV